METPQQTETSSPETNHVKKTLEELQDNLQEQLRQGTLTAGEIGWQVVRAWLAIELETGLIEAYERIALDLTIMLRGALETRDMHRAAKISDALHRVVQAPAGIRARIFNPVVVDQLLDRIDHAS